MRLFHLFVSQENKYKEAVGFYEPIVKKHYDNVSRKHCIAGQISSALQSGCYKFLSTVGRIGRTGEFLPLSCESGLCADEFVEVQLLASLSFLKSLPFPLYVWYERDQWQIVVLCCSSDSQCECHCSGQSLRGIHHDQRQ